ncbi:hypothetical protein AWC19_02705 [Mycobacterium palustre]|uniref:Uncharacterized protein n=1 Tax=Mycobacterium palustre TaxID=153971 RepID=A0A1X1ZUS3_9MYCO|nr:hypothetical protein AWC19_02705 [Mycobacterium palustre]
MVPAGQVATLACSVWAAPEGEAEIPWLRPEAVEGAALVAPAACFSVTVEAEAPAVVHRRTVAVTVEAVAQAAPPAGCWVTAGQAVQAGFRLATPAARVVPGAPALFFLVMAGRVEWAANRCPKQALAASAAKLACSVQAAPAATAAPQLSA